jgi:hypothetical protein
MPTELGFFVFQKPVVIRGGYSIGTTWGIGFLKIAKKNKKN